MAVQRKRGEWPCRDCRRSNGPDVFQCQGCMAARPFRRGGTHRVECDVCSCYGYLTVAMLEDIGLPDCMRRGCSGTLRPASVELATILGVDRFDDGLARVQLDKELSQHRSLGRAKLERKLAAGTLNDMSARAVAEVRSEQRQQGRERRLRAILPTPAPMAF